MSCGSNQNINQTFIIKSGNEISGVCQTVITNLIKSCDGNDDIEIEGNIIPSDDLVNDLGSEFKRFRSINVYSGNTSIWVSDIKVETPMVNLGLDSNNNNRTLTANNSILQNDVLLGGSY